MLPLLLTTATLALTASQKIVIAGATGRVGRLVVERLLARDDTVQVRGLVRDLDKARSCLPASDRITLVQCDLADVNAISSAVEGADAVIWCASGFTEQGALIDIEGLPACAAALPPGGLTPKVVMCSSAGVTRVDWPEAKKTKLVGASDIPIIRLNPGGILNQKVEAETRLRAADTPYCIVRPTGLKDDWPAGRPVFSQGDVAVGRTAPTDLADVLINVLDEPAACGKTFEVFTMAGYPAGEISSALEALASDTEPAISEAAVEASYRVLQQMLPGEQQDATKLEMGRTYEQVDRGEVDARERGAAPTERERLVASGALEAMGTAGSGAPTGRKRGLLRRLFRVGA